MLELSKADLVFTEMGGKQDVEFIVHKNSSGCRDCYQWPIIGQCYLSKLYDVQRCARCIETYSGEATDLEVKKASSDEKKFSRGVVLKLKIDNGGDVQNRRVKVEELWDKSGSHFSYAKLTSLAAGCVIAATEEKGTNIKDITKEISNYLDEHGNIVVSSDDGWETGSVSGALREASLAEPNADSTYLDQDGDKLTLNSNDEGEVPSDAFLARARFTYIDEDGEVTTISSDNELEDAFRQFFKKYHETEKNLGATEKKLGEELRFRITMTIPKD